MADYEPIDAGVPVRASMSGLVALRWQANGVEADFIISEDLERLINVSFNGPCIIRLLDEMLLSTEDNGGAKASPL